MLVKTHATGVLYGYVNIHSALRSEQILYTGILPLSLRIQQVIRQINGKTFTGNQRSLLGNVQNKKQFSILSST